jgi:hypothetical protein
MKRPDKNILVTVEGTYKSLGGNGDFNYKKYANDLDKYIDYLESKLKLNQMDERDRKAMNEDSQISVSYYNYNRLLKQKVDCINYAKSELEHIEHPKLDKRDINDYAVSILQKVIKLLEK